MAVLGGIIYVLTLVWLVLLFVVAWEEVGLDED